jgi:phosphoglycolate phosphatase-like HAD superfamily hydrolase
MDRDSLLFLDFDGVICDSINETIISSWVAYYKYLEKKIPLSVPCDYKRRFMLLRPFIRSGEDYLVIQDILANNKEIENQKQFDHLLAIIGKEVLQYYKEVFYKARSEIFSSYKKLWLSLNPLYPHMEKVMAKSAACENVYILSTKRTDFINEILQARSLDFHPNRIITAGQEEKLAIISYILDREKKQYAYFIDDQISHLIANSNNHIKTYLAAWGYVEPIWLKQKKVEILFPKQMIALMERFRC